MKLILKIVAVIVVLVLIILIAIPFLLEKNIDTIVRNTVSEQVNADVNFSKINLNLIKNFPNASISIENLEIVNRAPFENDTLVKAKEIIGEISFLQIIKGIDKGIKIDKFHINTANIKVLTNKDGKSNYDIFNASDTATPEPTNNEDTNFKLNLNYEIENSSILYKDEVSNITLKIEQLFHEGKGDISTNITNLVTDTKMQLSYEMHGVKYANKMPIFLEAIIGIDQNNKTYSFKDNKALINHIPLTFTGFVKLLNDKDTEINLNFVTKDGSFKNLLSALPNAYSKDINGVSVRGNFDLHGTIKGISNNQHIPLLDIVLDTQNSSFKYPDLPKGIENITLLAKVTNTTGNMDNTSVIVNTFKMKIDQDIFTANGRFSNLIKNPLIAFNANGTINLDNLNKAYPIELDTDLKGIFTADLKAKFAMNDVEKKQYNNIEREGQLSLSNFIFVSEELPHELVINTAKVDFTKNVVTLKEGSITSGSSDIAATGTLQNLIPFALTDDILVGDFNLRSKNFNVSDFMSSSETNTDDTESKSESEPITEEKLIPSFLNITSTFYAQNVLYDNLTLTNTSGKLAIKNQKAILKDVSTEIFGGNIIFNGTVNDAEKIPSFDMDLDLRKLNIAQSFQGFDMLKKITPIAQALEGSYSTKISLKGNLKKDLTPALESLKGNATANLINAKMNPEKNKLMKSLNQKTDFINFDKLNLKDLTAKLNFDDGKINVAPFDFKLKDDLSVKIGGSHSFDGTMNYVLNMDVPAKYLGNSTSGLLSKLSNQEKESINVPLPISLGGSFNQPKIGLDMKSAISNLSSQVIATQKAKVKNKITSEVSKKINEQVSKKVSGKAKDVLGGLLGSKKENKPSTTTNANSENSTKSNDVIKEKAGKLLEGLFKKKK